MKEWEKTEIEEGRPDGKISRRQFVKGMAWGAAAISLSSILPGCAAPPLRQERRERQKEPVRQRRR